MKAYEFRNKHTNPTSEQAKRKVSEVQTLVAAGHGGRIRGELCTVNTTDLGPRAARPTNFNEDTSFDEKTFEECIK